MKLPYILLASLACAASVNAQYFSPGWTPGQAVTSEPDSATATFDSNAVPTSQSRPANGDGSLSSLFDVSKLLSSGPVSSLFGKLGVNITERLKAAKTSPWDLRVPMITDDNYEEMIVNEPLTQEEEADRVWILVITATAGQTSGLSKVMDDQFDSAYNTSLVENDLPNVRWGRIDYLNVTYITTKWSIWQAPYLVILTDRGQTLRFYKASHVRLNADLIREFLKEEGWRNTPPWKTAFAPGGKREFVLHYYALVLKAIYDVVVRVPRWLLMILSGGLASVVMRLIHRNPETGLPVQYRRKPCEREGKAAESCKEVT
ncbi:hypothetical protein A0H81_09661 [Grifola frondosa]|uniref:Thioredoxin-like fold domain-containing protein n=1 Tax=Grifola frondosa TaxID=5627 RepID=A0A1C7M0Q1_GRIFR|nr:hypothetical protein A0H81_09661 [Grifola frondosa]